MKKRLSNELALSTIYKNRALSGMDLVAEFKGQYVSLFHKGEISYQDMNDLELLTKPVLDWLRTGDFMSARDLLKNIDSLKTEWLKDRVNEFIDYSYEYSWEEDLIERLDSGNINITGDLSKEDAILQIKSYLSFLGTSLELYVNKEITYEELPKITDFLPNLHFEIVENGVSYTVDDFVLYITNLKQTASEKVLTNCLTNITNVI